MGCIFSKMINDVSNIEVLDYTPPGTEYDYLRSRGTIIIEIDKNGKFPSFVSTLIDGLKMPFVFGLKMIHKEKFF